jgi:hypothetical protein
MCGFHLEADIRDYFSTSMVGKCSYMQTYRHALVRVHCIARVWGFLDEMHPVTGVDDPKGHLFNERPGVNESRMSLNGSHAPQMRSV